METKQFEDNKRRPFELSPDDSFDSCCGKVLITRKRLFIMQCSFCRRIFGCFDDFLEHLVEKHTEDAETTSTDIESDINEDFNLNWNSSDSGNKTESEQLEFPQFQRFDEVVILPAIEEVREELYNEIEDVPSVNDATTNSGTKLSEDINKPNESGQNVNEQCEQVINFVFNWETVPNMEHIELDAQKFKHKDPDLVVLEQKIQEKEFLNLLELYKKSKITEKEDLYIVLNEFYTMNDKKKRNTKYKCNKCDKAFTFKSLLRKHSIIHSDERKYTCHICNFAFKDRSNLRYHLLRHTEQKKFDCDLCTKKFFTRSELKQHRRYHTGEKPFICTHCGLGYTTSGALTLHVKKHDPKEAYKCAQCGKSCYGRASFKEHMIVHIKDKKHVCDICGAKFPRRKSMLRHKKLHEKWGADLLVTKSKILS